MKLIVELARYLEETGLLTNADRMALLAAGFQLPEPDDRDGYDYDDYDGYGEDGTDERPDPKASPRGRRGGGHERPDPRVTAEELASRVAQLRGQQAASFEGLLCLARRLDPSSSLLDAPHALRRASAGDLSAAVRAALRESAPDLRALWEGLASDLPWRVASKGDRGPAPRAFLTSLAARQQAPAQAHGWVLREQELAWAHALTLAQGAVVAAHAGLAEEEPTLLARQLAKRRHPVAYWAFVLVHNARLGAFRDAPSSPDDHTPAGTARDDVNEIFARAWSRALQIDPEAMRTFLAALAKAGLEGSPERGWDDLLWNAGWFVCPRGWDRGWPP